MFSLKSIKISIIFHLLLFSSCSFWRGAENQNVDASPAPYVARESKSAVPFSTKEPDIYQAEIVLTNYADGEKSERRSFTARKGAKFRCDYAGKTSFVQASENEVFLIDRDKKIYTVKQSKAGAASETTDSLKDFLAVEWLNGKREAKFERRGAENNLTKYLVSFEDAPNSNSEILIYVDENLKIPVRQEFSSVSGEQKNLVFSMELQNIKLEADDKLFELPADFRRVSSNEFQQITRQEKSK